MDLAGQVAIVTGATSGIGLAAAEAMSRAGIKLVLSGRRAELLDAHAKRLPDTVALAGEITDPGEPQRLIDTALARFGRLDICYNNAGQNVNGPIETIDIEAMCAMMRTNVEAAFRMAYTAARHFKAQGHGHLLVTSSVLGTKVRPLAGAYCASKFAVEALHEALRMELARTQVKVTCIEPGLVITDLHRDHAERPEKVQNVARPLMPADIARMVMFALDQPPHASVPRVMMLAQDQVV